MADARAGVEGLPGRRTASTGYEAFAARDGQHDDLTLALAIAVWWGSRMDRARPGALVLVQPNSD